MTGADRLGRYLSSAVMAALLPACGDPVSEAQAQAKRQACRFSAGAMASQTLATDDPVGSKIPIDHVVLMMQENRSFDAYFSQLTVPGQTVDVASPDATNPDLDGGPVQRFHWSAETASNSNSGGKDFYCFSDTDHGWDQSLTEYDDGLLDGFVRTNYDDGDGKRAMGYYDATDIPFYYSLAQAFAISDRHFCSVLGPTWPNRIFYFSGTSYGLTNNYFPPENKPDGQPYPNLFTELTAAGVTWKVYAQDLPSPAIFPAVIAYYSDHLVPIGDYYTDAANGALPQVSVVEGTDSGVGANVDEHPPQDMQVGEAFIAGAVNALLHSPNWPTSVFFLTYDENGGEYDHVPPPSACEPDDIPAQIGQPGAEIPAKFDRYGFRTPLIVVSPYARRGYVSHEVVDHTSILRFVEARFGLPAMTARDANAWPLLDMFDFAHADTSVPALAAAPINTAQQMQCLADFPPSNGGF